MKRICFVFLLLFVLISCESEGELTRTEVGTLPINEEAVLAYTGAFYPTSGITVTGIVNIYKDGGVYKLSLQDFSSTNGPDLKVYLSSEAYPATIINLGALGNGMVQSYLIPDGVDFDVYDHVLIHCQQYNHLYAIAPLENVN